MNKISYDKDIFAENLLRLMKEKHCKQIDIARLLDVSKATVSAYCAGKQMPRMDKIEQLARHFGVSRSALIEDNPGSPYGGTGQAQGITAPTEGGSPVLRVYNALNDAGQAELLRYGRYLSDQPEYRAEE